jgi:hypothetical protein
LPKFRFRWKILSRHRARRRVPRRSFAESLKLRIRFGFGDFISVENNRRRGELIKDENRTPMSRIKN